LIQPVEYLKKNGTVEFNEKNKILYLLLFNTKYIYDK